jgi:hypothetical protein
MYIFNPVKLSSKLSLFKILAYSKLLFLSRCSLMEESGEVMSWKLSSRYIVYRNAVQRYFNTLDSKENCSEKLYANAELGLVQSSTSEWYRTSPWLAVRLHWYNGRIQCWPSMNF